MSQPKDVCDGRPLIEHASVILLHGVARNLRWVRHRAKRCSDIGASNLTLAEVLGKAVVSMGSNQLLSDSAGLDDELRRQWLHPRQKVLDAEQTYPLCSQSPFGDFQKVFGVVNQLTTPAFTGQLIQNAL